MQNYVEFIAVSSIPIAFIGLIVQRCFSKKGIGVRSIQFLAVATIVPAIVVMAIERLIDGAVVGTLLGGLVGYLFSNIGDFDRSRSSD